MFKYCAIFFLAFVLFVNNLNAQKTDIPNIFKGDTVKLKVVRTLLSDSNILENKVDTFILTIYNLQDDQEWYLQYISKDFLRDYQYHMETSNEYGNWRLNEVSGWSWDKSYVESHPLHVAQGITGINPKLYKEIIIEGLITYSIDDILQQKINSNIFKREYDTKNASWIDTLILNNDDKSDLLLTRKLQYISTDTMIFDDTFAVYIDTVKSILNYYRMNKVEAEIYKSSIPDSFILYADHPEQVYFFRQRSMRPFYLNSFLTDSTFQLDKSNSWSTSIGRVNIMYFRFSPCLPCNQVDDFLKTLSDKYDKDVEITVFNTWGIAPKLDFKTYDIDYQTSRDVFEVNNAPFIYILDKSGKVVYRVKGFNDLIQNKIEDLVRQHH